jgi:hypothetical protein
MNSHLTAGNLQEFGFEESAEPAHWGELVAGP